FYFSYLTLDTKPASLEKLQEEFKRAASINPAVTLSIRADRDAPLGLLVKVADAAKQAGIKSVTLFTVPQTSGTDSLRASNTDGSMERNGAKSAERLLNQPANAPMENQSKPVSDGSVSDRKSTRLNSSHEWISYAVFCLKKKST